MMSNLERLFMLQLELMDALEIPRSGKEGVDVYSDYFLAACIGLSVEASEVLDEINIATRPWATKDDREVREALAREAIDAFFYFIEIMILLGISPQRTVQLYEEKWKINMRRASEKSKES